MSRKSIALIAIITFVIACKKPGEPPPPSTTTTATITATAPPPPLPLDHFKFWKIQDKKFAETMQLFGQCDNEKWPARVGPAQYLGNPVDKKNNDSHTPINGKLHYVAYKIIGSTGSPQRSVTLSNQFTEKPQRWLIKEPTYLLVPAGKAMKGKPEPQKGEHFLCYQVNEGKPFGVNVSLEDQFDVARGKREQIQTLTPKYFCVPVNKFRDKKPPVTRVDDKTHLAIYEFVHDKLEKPIVVGTTDQLIPENTLTVLQSEWLAVPSKKIGKCEEVPKPK